jgi:hypothetical protein
MKLKTQTEVWPQVQKDTLIWKELLKKVSMQEVSTESQKLYSDSNKIGSISGMIIKSS